tara:strand:+ start:149 stop:964 length:816 start_codon:yes stop_codon:yes gene_type:complete
MKTLIIAEIGWNHMGNMDLAEQMIFRAKDSGADIAKFQTWKVTRLKNGEWDSDGRREIYNNAELSLEDHLFLKAKCKEYSIGFLSSAFSVEDAILLHEIGCDSIKIPSFEVSNIKLLEYCKANFKKLFLSTGTATEKEIIDVKNLFQGWHGQLTVMHCVSAYPCEAVNINLPRILHLRQYFQNVGFSDHTQGIKSTISSINLNPIAIEKHFTIDRSLPGRDNQFAILPDDMKFITDYILGMNQSMIDHGINYQEIEDSSRKKIIEEDLMDK